MKHFLMIIGCLFAFSVMGQKEVVSAYNANKDGDYRAASTYIEQAILIEKAKTKDKTWRYRGEIYLNISRDTSLTMEYPNALRIAMESYLQAKELDIKERYEDEIRIGLAQVQIGANGKGISYYNTTSFDLAASSFDLAAEVARTFEIVDTMAVYNAALCYEKAGLNDLAIDRYKECAEIEYNLPSVLLNVCDLYRKMGNDDEALKTLQLARLNYPDEIAYITEEFNMHIQKEDEEKALACIIDATTRDSTNYQYWSLRGNIFQRLTRHTL